MLDEATRRCDRSHFDERLAAQLQEAAQQHRGLAVLIARADGIAWINKRWGRAAGDSVLRKLARRLAASLAPEDVFARYDGNRFGIIRWVASADRAAAFAQHLSSRVGGRAVRDPGRSRRRLPDDQRRPGVRRSARRRAGHRRRRRGSAPPREGRRRQPNLLRLNCGAAVHRLARGATSRRCAAPSPSAAAWPRSSPPTGRPSARPRARGRSRP